MRFRALQGLTIACLLFAVACAPAPTAGTAADETALRAMGTKYADAWNNRDVPALVAMVADDYEVVAPDGTVVKGKAAYEETEKKQMTGLTGLPLKLSVTTSYVQWGGANAAAIGGTWAMAGVPAGMGAEKGAWTVFARKGADGEWRMASGLVADAPAPPPPPPPPAPAKGKGK